MITSTVTVRVNSGTAPFTYEWYDDLGNSCVSFSNQSGITNSRVISTDVIFSDLACYSSHAVRIKVTDATGNCYEIFAPTIPNPCLNLPGVVVNVTPAYTYCATVTGGGTFTYEWSWDESVYVPVGPIDQACITFDRIDPNATSTTVYVTVYNEQGCFITEEVTYTFCEPVAANRTVNMACNNQGTGYTSTNFALTVTPCPNCPIDWSTVFFYNIPPGISIQTVGTNLFRLTAGLTLAAGVYQMNYTVRDICGSLSNPGTITIVVTDLCSEDLPFILLNKTVQLDCDAGLGIGDILYIDIEDCIVPNTNIDWTSFAFQPCDCQSTTSSRGCNIVWNATTHQVEYEICALTGADYFEWSICDLGGTCGTSSAFLNIILDCTSPPIAVDDAECAFCGEAVTIDILANDDPNGGIINPASVMITQSPLNGSVIINPGGTITYTPNPGFAGTDTFKYTVQNTHGQTSNEATVTIEVTCAGEAATATVCA